MRNATDTPRTLAEFQLDDGTRLAAETPSLGVLTLSFEPPAQQDETTSTDETDPATDDEHDAATPTQIALDDGPTIDVDPAGDHLEVTISCTGRAHAGIALTRSEARELATALLCASAPSFAEGVPDEIREHVATVKSSKRDSHDLAAEQRDESLHRWYFPRTRTWRGKKVPASNVHVYRTVDQRDTLEVEYVDTPEGPVMLIDGRRPISLDDTNLLMTDVALYRQATDAVNASIRRREEQNR